MNANGILEVELISYAIVFIILGVVAWVVINSRNRLHLRVLHFFDISTVLIFIYIISLGIYFHSYYMESLDVYPSAVIAKIWLYTVLFFVLPLNSIYLVTWIARFIHLRLKK